MAEISLNTLQGDLIILKSAYQGLVVEIRDSNEAMGVARGTVQGATSALVGMKTQVDEGNDTFRKLKSTLFLMGGPLTAFIEYLSLTKKGLDDVDESTVKLIGSTGEWNMGLQFGLEIQTALAEARQREIIDNEALLALAIARRDVTLSQQAADAAIVASQESETTEDEILSIQELIGWNETAEKAEEDRATNLFNIGKKTTDAAIQGNKDKLASEKETATSEQKLSIGQAIINIGKGLAKTLSAGFPVNIPLLIGYIAQTLGIVSTIKSVKFAEGGHGELGGERHSQGGTHIPGIGEAERGEYFGIINRQMTRKYSQDLPGIFDSLNKGKFHDVWDNTNIHLQTELDPYTKKMYDLMSRTPNIYTDSNGDIIKEYPDGYKRVIRQK